MILSYRAIAIALCALASSFSAIAQEAPFFQAGFEITQPTTDAEAARFLNQATFGATVTDIADLRNKGFSNWIEAQRMQPTTRQRLPLQVLAATLTTGGSINRDDRMRQFWRTAVTGEDQLRQRMAYALSQIVVISDQGDALSGETLMVAEWNDLLLRNAFGSYRTLLVEATRSPMMGRWLTSIRNRKLEGTVAPDENYAREIMQLFSIGLYDRQMDGTPVEIAGQRVATYDNATIATVARAFTGLSYDCTGNEDLEGTRISMQRTCGVTCTGTDCRFIGSGTRNLFTLFFNDPPRDDSINNFTGDTVLNRGLRHPDFYRPMVCYPRYNDTGRQANGTPWNPLMNQPSPAKSIVISGTQLLNLPEIGAGQVTPPNCNLTDANISAANRTACLNYCETGVVSLVDTLFNHPNVPPFVAYQLIQRFVTSNPSPAYVRRVACAFAGSSSSAAECSGARIGPRGDLAKTLRAVLLDTEARAVLASAPINFGKPREPMLKMLAIWRSFGAVMAPLAARNGGTTSPELTYGQRPIGAPSVFNFYEPDYQQPGPISQVNVAGSAVANPDDALVSPEFKIINEVTAVNTANALYGVVCNGYGGNNCNGVFAATPPVSPYLSPAAIDALPLTNNQALIEALNVRMMGGAMSGTIVPAGACANGLAAGGVGTGMKGALNVLVQCAIPVTFGATSNDERRRKALYLIHLIAISPEYGTQR